MNNSILLLFIITIFIGSCTEIKTDNKKSIIIENYYNKLGIDTKFRISEKKQNLIIHIEYCNGYYLTDKSNRLILEFLIVALAEEIQDYETLTVNYDYCNLAGKKSHFYKKIALTRIIDKSKDRLKFQNIFFDVVRKLDTEAIIGYNNMIEDINRIVKYEAYKGDFWDVLEDFSARICDKEKNVEEKINDFEFLITAAEFERVPIAQSITKPEVLKKIVEDYKINCDNK